MLTELALKGSRVGPGNGGSGASVGIGPDGKKLAGYEVLPSESFQTGLRRERKRTERSHRPFVLLLVSSDTLLDAHCETNALEGILPALGRSSRETDLVGWYEDRLVLGIIFTEVKPDGDRRAVADALLAKVDKALSGVLTRDQMDEIQLSVHVFPDDWEREEPDGPADRTLYPDLTGEDWTKKSSRCLKRLMDIAGSLIALAVFAPLVLVIAVLIKLNSKGPVHFRSQRIGQFGRPFTFLKFRSMRTGNDPAIHKQFVTELITGNNGTSHSTGGNGDKYKLTADPRVTRIGRFLRRTSLDELPQFINVLRGEMSLVGPRPPLPYEVACYDIWHKQRLMAVKPGITGLWQINGRSRVKFDDMVRMDLEYAQGWSLWLDLKILLLTPRAVLSGTGAY